MSYDFKIYGFWNPTTITVVSIVVEWQKLCVISCMLFLQNLPSVVVGHVLNPQPGEVVLDMCAAPGLFQGTMMASVLYPFNP